MTVLLDAVWSRSATASSCSSPWRRATPTTVAPRRARSTAILRPSPDDAPVTTATWPSYRFMRAATRPSGVPGPSGPAEALSFGPRQAEDTPADDVALHLRG